MVWWYALHIKLYWNGEDKLLHSKYLDIIRWIKTENLTQYMVYIDFCTVYPSTPVLMKLDRLWLNYETLRKALLQHIIYEICIFIRLQVETTKII